MLTLREISPQSAYEGFYDNAYPYGLDDPFRAALIDELHLDTISMALASDQSVRLTAQVASSSTGNALPGAVAITNLPQTQRVTIQQDYGNAQNLPVAVTDADQVALLKPSSRRVFLVIQNRSGSANAIFVAFGTTASAANGIEILPGGSETFQDFIPQDDVHIACDTGGTATAVLLYSNKDEKE